MHTLLHLLQGELGSNLYVIEKGKFDIYVEKEDSKKGPKKVTSRGAGTYTHIYTHTRTFADTHTYTPTYTRTHTHAGKCFGELALMYNAPRAATVRAAKDSVLWVVDRYTFRRIAKDVSTAKLAMYVSVCAACVGVICSELRFHARATTAHAHTHTRPPTHVQVR